MLTEDKSRMTLLGILRRIIIMALAAAIVVTPMSFLTGCANPFNKQEEVDDEDEEDDDEDEDEDESTKEDESESEDGTEEEPIDVEALTMPDSAVSSNVWSVAGKTLVFARDRVISHDNKSGKNKILWKDKLDDDYIGSEMSMFSAGTGLVLGDRLYFTKSESRRDDDGVWRTDIHIYSMGIDGKNQKSLYTIAGAESYEQDLAYKDGVLFCVYNSSEYPECIKLDDNGDIDKILEPSEIKEFNDYDPSELVIQSVMQNGHRFLFPNITADECGKMIFSKGYNTLVIVDASTGEKTEYRDQYPVSMYGDKLLVYHYNSQSNDPTYDYGVIDLSTEKYKKILNMDSSLRVCSMDEDYIYYDQQDGMHPAKDFSILKCDIGTGEVSALYTFKTEKSELPSVSNWDIVSNYSDGNLYTVLNRDYKLSYVKIDPKTGDMDYIAEDFYDPGIYDVGTLVFKDDEALYDGQRMATAAVSTLQLDDKYPGAAKINKTLMEQTDGAMAQIDDCFDECIQWYEESGGEYFIPYEFTSDFGYISYNDGKIINIVQEGYDYYGGAHGMPYWISFVFDLQTGERLYLSDLISIDEDTLDDLLVDYATKHMNDIGESYWEGYEETVKMYGGLDSDYFILQDDGVDFYYPPYLLTSFAGGFQEIVVPYSELNPKFR